MLPPLMSDYSNVKECLDSIGERFVQAEAEGVNSTFLFELSGDEPQTFHVVVADGKYELKQGAVEEPNLTVKMKSADYVKLTNGKLNGQIAFMTGKLKLSGQVALVMKLQKMFPPKKK